MLVDDEPVNMPSTYQTSFHRRLNILVNLRASTVYNSLRTDCRVDNDTLVIDMRNSWTNGSVTVVSINKTASGVPVLNDGCLFAAPDNKTFFQFGGENNWINPNFSPQPVSVAQFTLSGKSNDSWSDFDARISSGFDNITRTTHALAATVDDTFFMLGGIIDSHTSDETTNISGLDTVSVGGILAFNMTTGKWTNSSMPSELVRPRAKNGILNSVPSFGPVGLLLEMFPVNLTTSPYTSQVTRPGIIKLRRVIYRQVGMAFATLVCKATMARTKCRCLLG